MKIGSNELTWNENEEKNATFRKKVNMITIGVGNAN